MNISIGYRELTCVGLVFLSIQFLLTCWITARIGGSIKQEYDKKLEDYRNAAKIRERAAGVAALLAKSYECEDPEDRQFLQMAWELSLWLPSEILVKLRSCYYGGTDTEVKQVLLATRKILLGDAAGTLNVDDIPPLITRLRSGQNASSNLCSSAAVTTHPFASAFFFLNSGLF